LHSVFGVWKYSFRPAMNVGRTIIAYELPGQHTHGQACILQQLFERGAAAISLAMLRRTINMSKVGQCCAF
jgi:hypothetical protein